MAMIGSINNSTGTNSNNFDSIRSLSLLNQHRTASQREVQRTSANLNINNAIANVAAYSIEESLRIRTRTLGQANENIQNDTALLKTAQGSGSSIVDSIKEIQQLATTATDESLTDDDRLVIQRDINRLVNQISADSQITFNGRKLIDGSSTSGSQAIATVLSNDSLSRATTASTMLTDLQNGNGVNLGINASDRVTASYVKDGNAYTTSFTVGTNTLEDVFVNLNKINGFDNAAFIGGGRGILVEPTAPIEPTAPDNPSKFKPTAPNVERPGEEAPKLFVPSEYVSASEPVAPTAPTAVKPDIANYGTDKEYDAAWENYDNEMAAYDAAKAQYDLKKAAYDAVQAGAEVIQNPTDETDPQHEAKLEAYRKAVSEFSTQLAKDYVQYHEDKKVWNEYDKKYDEYKAYEEKYNQELKPKYLEDMEQYRKDYAQYQVDLADYRLMTADIVQSDSDGLHVTARRPGLEGQISGVSINVADGSGNVKFTANAALNNFKTTTFAEDAKEDNSIFFQIGDTVGQAINFGFNDMRAEAFGLKGANGNIISVSTKEDADAALSTINNALGRATDYLQTIGSSERSLGYIADTLANEISNIQEPDLMIRNMDRARQLTFYAMDQFRMNTQQSMFAIANQHSSAVLGLLR